MKIRKIGRNLMLGVNTLLVTLILSYITGCEEKTSKPTLPGMDKAIVCMSCHGLTGNKHKPKTPRLAGQYSDYLVEAMNAYADGRRTHELMKTFVAGLSEKDIQDLAEFYSGQKGM